ncbi:Hypothetical predicted protein [Pelobates cultripes]|uniref:Uncharacterized protein n=1 Tax=Pelobates cultripes TaxID=61616 RepID=A0AAD1SMK6_PELCU|nr:Hypothetical predicted protein [Pelobates cultripes]
MADIQVQRPVVSCRACGDFNDWAHYTSPCMMHISPEMGHMRPKTPAMTIPRIRDISKLLTGTPIPKASDGVDKEASTDLSDKEVSPPQARPTKPTPSGSSAPEAASASTPSTKQDKANI